MCNKNKYCIKCNSSNIKISTNKIICKDCGYSFSLYLFNNTYLRRVAQDYSSNLLSDIMVVWMSVLLIELALSATLRTILNLVRDKEFVNNFVDSNYRISYSKKLILLFVKYPKEIKDRLLKVDIESISDREYFDCSFTELIKDLNINQNLEEYLSTIEGHSYLDFEKEFIAFKEIRHHFRRGESLGNIDLIKSRNLTYEYLTRLSSIVDIIVESEKYE